jgi:hypothetical protein
MKPNAGTCRLIKQELSVVHFIGLGLVILNP